MQKRFLPFLKMCQQIGRHTPPRFHSGAAKKRLAGGADAYAVACWSGAACADVGFIAVTGEGAGG